MTFGMLTTQEESEEIGLSVKTLRKYVKEGKLHPKFLGRTYYFEMEELESLFLDKNPNLKGDSDD